MGVDRGGEDEDDRSRSGPDDTPFKTEGSDEEKDEEAQEEEQHDEQEEEEESIQRSRRRRAERDGSFAVVGDVAGELTQGSDLESVAVSLAESLRGEQARSEAAAAGLADARRMVVESEKEAIRWRDAHDRKEMALARSEASFEKAADAQTSLLRVLAVLRDTLPQGRAEIDSAIQSAAIAA